MQFYFSSVLATYGAIISTYTACKWLIESRPYIEIRKAPPSHSGSLLVAVHNPGRRPIFIIDSKIYKRQARGTNPLLKVVPYRESGMSEDEVTAMFSGELWLIAPPGGSVQFTIGPIYRDTNTLVVLSWHRGWVAWPMLHDLWQRTVNPLRVHVTASMVDSLNTYGFLS